MFSRPSAALLGFLLLIPASAQEKSPGRWSAERARKWQSDHPWLVGCNFIPSTAINQLEMWQEDTFDLKTIDRELKWAEDLGFTSVRVFLHDLLWKQDQEGFLRRMEQFLDTADRHKIGVLFVLMDSVWDPHPQLGKQRAPKPHVHNSGWVQSPGAEIIGNPKRHDELRPYVQGVLSHFKRDRRIHGWDLINEPNNTNNNSYCKREPPDKLKLALMLLRKTFAWAREVNPDQPLTAAPWEGDWSSLEKMSPINRFMFENSDVISFHEYGDLNAMKRRVEQVKNFNRPLALRPVLSFPCPECVFFFSSFYGSRRRAGLVQL
ncbi:MAG: cellulase family glycosylhydrolase, partial [Verrucomicrobiales bacterium]|nr:cellulase family glycosylhydrolase [Verrucomicrobiales bacterium]